MTLTTTRRRRAPAPLPVDACRLPLEVAYEGIFPLGDREKCSISSPRGDEIAAFCCRVQHALVHDYVFSQFRVLVL
jgi:hypothetical protein